MQADGMPRPENVRGLTRNTGWNQASWWDAMRLLGAGTTGLVAACGSQIISAPAAPMSTGETMAPPTADGSEQPHDPTRRSTGRDGARRREVGRDGGANRRG